MKLIAIALAAAGACLALSDEPDTAEPEAAADRCPTGLVAPDVAAVLAIDAPPLAEGHAALASLAGAELPAGLDFTPGPQTEESKRRFREGLRSIANPAKAALMHYHRAMLDDNHPVGIRRVACRGAVAALASLAFKIESAPLPDSLGAGDYEPDARRAYCDALKDTATSVRRTIASMRSRCNALARVKSRGSSVRSD